MMPQLDVYSGIHANELDISLARTPPAVQDWAYTGRAVQLTISLVHARIQSVTQFTFCRGRKPGFESQSLLFSNAKKDRFANKNNPAERTGPMQSMGRNGKA